MTAIRIEVPPGVASPVWLAHIVRNAVTRALRDDLADPRPLRVEAEDNSEAATQGLSDAMHARARRDGSSGSDFGGQQHR